MADGRLNLFRESQNLLARVLDTGADEEGNSLGLINGLGQRSGLGRVRVDNGTSCGDSRGSKGVILCLLHGDVTGDNEDGDTVARHGGLDGVVQDNASLLSRVHHFAVAGAFLEDGLRVGFLEELRADLARWDVASNGEDLGAVAVGVVKPLDKVSITRAARGSAHGQLAGGERIRLRGEGGSLLIADVDPLNRGAAHRIHDGVKGVTHEAVNALDALGLEHLDELCSVCACHEVFLSNVCCEQSPSVALTGPVSPH